MSASPPKADVAGGTVGWFFRQKAWGGRATGADRGMRYLGAYIHPIFLKGPLLGRGLFYRGGYFRSPMFF